MISVINYKSWNQDSFNGFKYDEVNNQLKDPNGQEIPLISDLGSNFVFHTDRGAWNVLISVIPKN